MKYSYSNGIQNCKTFHCMYRSGTKMLVVLFMFVSHKVINNNISVKFICVKYNPLVGN